MSSTNSSDKSGIRLEHLRKEYGDTVALEDLNLVARPGEILGIAGPNGAGTVSYTHLTLPTILRV